MHFFFCFTLSVWSLLASFCSHWTILDGTSFCSFWGRLFCFKHADIIPAFSIVPGPHTVLDSFSTAGIPRGTLSQLVLLVEWLCTIVGATHTHTHTHTHTCTHPCRMRLTQKWNRLERPLFNHLKWVSLSLLAYFLNLKYSTPFCSKVVTFKRLPVTRFFSLMAYNSCGQNTGRLLDFVGMVTVTFHLKSLWNFSSFYSFAWVRNCLYE